MGHNVKSVNRPQMILFMAIFVGLGIGTLLFTRAATPTVAVESEASTLAGCATSISDNAASGGSAVKFGSASGCATSPGAKLPISYNLSSLGGTVRYVATSGSDSSGNGSINAPYATVAKAYSVATSGDTIVVRGGIYREGNLTITTSKPIKLIAYPNEAPTFNGAQPLNGGWSVEGSLSYHTYTPRPVTDGSGISFTTGQNLNGDGVGKFPDQAWVGSTQLRQVSAKSSVVDGTFWVDSTNNRIYLTSSNVAQGNVEASDKNIFISVQAPNTTLEGLTITRYSNTASDYGVVKFNSTADSSVMRNIKISDTAFIAVFYSGSSDINTNALMQNVTVQTSNWMGVSATYTDGLTLNAVDINHMNQFNEFTYSPQSGALKTSRTRDTEVINSDISNNKSQGLWFDQSNLRVIVANNQILDNDGTGLFFEISDNLYLINNYIRATGSARAVKLAASSGLKLVNNTIIGGSDAIGIYVDSRSIAGCSDPSQPLCSGSYSSDRDTVRPFPATMTWFPSLDLMINNIVAYPTSSGYCGTTTALCITKTNASATVPLNIVLHPANASLGIPQTSMNGNVYANGTGNIINTASGNFTTPSAFSTAMAGAPVSINGLDTSSRYGNSFVNSDGSPTAALSSVHAQAEAVPSDATINIYMPAGTKHYGVTYK